MGGVGPAELVIIAAILLVLGLMIGVPVFVALRLSRRRDRRAP